jgi:hypothetical protein
VRILWLQGKRANAFKLVDRVVTMRAAVYRKNNGPRFWDALFFKYRMQDDDGDPTQAAITVRRVIDINVGENGQELIFQRARACWFFAKYAVKVGSGATSDQARNYALRGRSTIVEREWPNEDTDEGFM